MTPRTHCPAPRSRRTVAALALAFAVAGGCAVGPNYHRPDAPVPQRYKEAAGWKPAEPREAASGSAWWSVYNDTTLDELEKQIDISNQTLKASEAAWRQAVALVSQSRAQFFPTIGVAASATRSGGPGGRSATGTTGTGTTVTPSTHPTNQFDVNANGSWDLDIWGRIRRTLESSVASAQASEAELAAARLSAQATLASDYIQLRIAEEQKQLLDQTVEAYTRSLEIAQNQYRVGVVAKADVITAETQLDSAQSQQTGIGVTRAVLEHAIAMLIGKAPGDFSLAPATLGATVPVVPIGLPSTLLERRPDVAEAERKMAAANAQIGVAVAGFFPDLTLSGSYGFARRWAQVRGARAAYDGAVASYRQTVLTAFEQVEDELATLRILEQQFDIQQKTVQSANLSLQLTLNQYRAGTVAYTSVVTAQTIALGDAEQLLTIRQNRLTASVALIQALGGGWSAEALGSRSGNPSTAAAAAAPAAAAPVAPPTP